MGDGRGAHMFGLRALALAWGLNALGDALFFIWQSRLGSDVFQSASRVPYLSANLVLFVGLLALLHADQLYDRVRAALDSLLLTVCAGLMMWRFVFAPALQSAAGTAARPILVIYTVLVLGLLFLSLFSLASSRTTPQSLRPRAILCAAFLLICASNTLLLVGAAHNSQRTQILGTILWSAAMLVAGLSALQCRDLLPTPGTEPIFRLARLVPSILPYGFLLIAIALAADVLDELDSHERTNITVAIIILSLLALRQILVAIQNVRLQNQLVRFSLELDDLVALRTRQLEAQNRFSRRLNAAQLTQESLAALLEFAPILLPKHPFALWLTTDGDALKLAGTNAPPEWAAWLAEHAPTEGDFATNRTPPMLRVAPLRRGESVLGFLAIIIEPQGFDPTEDAILKFMAREGALALQNARLYEQALVDAEHDDVTGLLNHRGVQERLAKLVAAAHLSGEPLGVALMDLDRFKLFNDTYTHVVGDLVLKHVAAILCAEMGEGALFGRFGGDEFLLIFPGAHREAVLHRIEVLGDLLASRGFLIPGQGQPVPLAVSFGVAMFPDDATGLQRLLSVADSHLFAAKNSGLSVRSSTEMERTRARLRTHDSFSALDAIVAAIDSKDSYTRAHSEDVTELALQLASALGLSEETRKMLRTGALLHDVGKIAVPDEVLCKPGQLTPEEFAQMKTHPWIGAILVSAMPGLGNIIEMVRNHHERFDGTGYPDRLAGEAIPPLGRLLAVADAYSAMTQHRPYRRALSEAEALERIEAGAGTQFDPHMAATFVRLKRAALNGTRAQAHNPASAEAA